MTVAHRLAPVALLVAGAISPAHAAPPSPPATAPCTAKACDGRGALVTQIYPVADLVVPPGTAPEACPAPCPAPKCGIPGVQARKDSPSQTGEKGLIRALTRSVAPGAWVANGGHCRVEYMPLTLSLVVSATPDVQEQVADTLASLRRLQDMQVAVELRVVSASDDAADSLWHDLDLPSIECADEAPATHRGGMAGVLKCGPLKLTFVDDKQLFRLMEHLQGDTRTNVMQAPKMTLFNGQTSTLEVVDLQQFVTGVSIRSEGGNLHYEPRVEAIPLGSRFQIQPAISADRRFVRVKLRGELTSLDSPEVPLFPVSAPINMMGRDGKPKSFTHFIQLPDVTSLLVDQTLVIADGKTAVLSGWKRAREVDRDLCPPAFSEIPYLNQLFHKNVRRHDNLLVLVTPRIVVHEEEEQTAAADGDPKTYSVEEQEETGCCDAASPCCPAAKCQATVATAALVKAYHDACAAGRHAEATRLAVQALALDPACFSKPCGASGKVAHPPAGH